MTCWPVNPRSPACPLFRFSRESPPALGYVPAHGPAEHPSPSRPAAAKGEEAACRSSPEASGAGRGLRHGQAFDGGGPRLVLHRIDPAVAQRLIPAGVARARHGHGQPMSRGVEAAGRRHALPVVAAADEGRPPHGSAVLRALRLVGEPAPLAPLQPREEWALRGRLRLRPALDRRRLLLRDPEARQVRAAESSEAQVSELACIASTGADPRRCARAM